MPDLCTCPHLLLGGKRLEQRNWGEACPEHGVGSAYFQALPQRPFGFRDEEFATMTRGQYLEMLDELERAEELDAWEEAGDA
jgi:hypothetical protein